VAQLGSALDWGSRGRRFKSCQPDVMKKDRICAVFFHYSGLPGGPAGSKNCITDATASAAAILSRAVQPDLLSVFAARQFARLRSPTFCPTV
jgi:hypothetical protein